MAISIRHSLESSNPGGYDSRVICVLFHVSPNYKVSPQSFCNRRKNDSICIQMAYAITLQMTLKCIYDLLPDIP